MAKKVAEGDACPISLLPMEDINPSYTPRALKPKPLNGTVSTKSDVKTKRKGKASVSEKPSSATILTFFSEPSYYRYRTAFSV